MSGSNESWEKDIPTWDGSQEKWNTYLEDVEWYFYATSTKDRHLVASRLARKLSGQARNALKGLKAKDFAGVQGIPKLLKILQARIGDLPVPDLGHKLDEFIFRLKRKAGESMNEWGLRSIEVYRKLTTALDRVRGHETDIGTFEDPLQKTEPAEKFPWPQGGSWDDWTEARDESWEIGEDAEERWGNEVSLDQPPGHHQHHQLHQPNRHPRRLTLTTHSQMRRTDSSPRK